MREARRNGSLGSESKVLGLCERFFPAEMGESLSNDGGTGLWVVLVARHRILRASALEVRDELETLLK